MTQAHGSGPSQQSMPHLPVLLEEVLDALRPLEGMLVLDGTFGAGGYSRALLETGASVLAIDRDPNVAPHVAALSADFGDRFTFFAGRFSELETFAGQMPRPVDAIVLDIGVSSMQLDEAGRGFSFLREGPLDMRMSGEGTSAADLVNTLDEKALADLLFALGEERKSRRIAQAIISERASDPISTTSRLASIIEKAIGRKPGDIHPATRSFQALRIAVNAELDELAEGLFAAERLLGEGGRLAVVTFHSLEDRIVKRFLSGVAASGPKSRHMPMQEATAPRWSPVAKPVRAGAGELSRNPRARSATLRSARRTDATARPFSLSGLGIPFSLRRGAA
ncbi:MAG TPA: 16S rRNA (cytosine(1402)-N(4))-methyltransferase RsmH [Devosiaceae bacterium]